MKATAPTRIDLAGGWTDVPLFADEHGGEVVGFAINLRSSATWKRTSKGCIEGKYDSTAPLGGGLGTTGSVNVAIMAAINKGKSSKEYVAECAFKYECLLGNSGGRQDQYFAAFGGFNHFLFHREGVSRKALTVCPLVKSWLQSQLFLYDSGLQHNSGALHDIIWRMYQEGDENTHKGLHLLKSSAPAMVEALSTAHRSKITCALNQACHALDILNPSIISPFRVPLESLRQSQHVLAWKPVGAGAGGCVLVLVKEGSEQHVKEACETKSWSRIPWDYDDLGIQYAECRD